MLLFWLHEPQILLLHAGSAVEAPARGPLDQCLPTTTVKRPKRMHPSPTGPLGSKDTELGVRQALGEGVLLWETEDPPLHLPGPTHPQHQRPAGAQSDQGRGGLQLQVVTSTSTNFFSVTSSGQAPLRPLDGALSLAAQDLACGLAALAPTGT